MRKYFAFYTGNIKNVLAYRGPIVVWIASNILNLLVILAVWMVAAGGSTFGGYTRNELITYYIVGLFFTVACWLDAFLLDQRRN